MSVVFDEQIGDCRKPVVQHFIAEGDPQLIRLVVHSILRDIGPNQEKLGKIIFLASAYFVDE